MISAIELRNFKCFQDELIEFAPLTLLTGLNGSGKSTIIQSLLLLRQSYEENVLAKGVSLNGDLVNIGTGRDLLFERTEGIEEISIAIERSSGHALYKWIFEYQREANFLNTKATDSPTAFDTFPLFNDNFEYLCAERFGPRNTFPKSNYVVAEHRHIGIHGEFTQHYLHLYGKKPIVNMKARHEQTKEMYLINQVQAWLSTISPGVRIETSEFAQADLMGMQFRFVDADVSNAYRPTNVGFGLTYTLPVIVALLKAEAGDLVIIENPEAHLHPRGQRSLGELLARVAAGGVQVLVETHSDHVLNGVRIAVRDKLITKDAVKINFVEKVFKQEQFVHQIISPNISEEGRLDFWPKGFFDEWDRALNELFTSGGKVHENDI